MLIIRLTQKLAKKIKVAPTAALPRDPNPFADWTANLFTAQRTQYIILTNSASLYSVIFYGRGITESDIFIDRALSYLAEHMRGTGFGEIFDKRIIPLAAEIVFSKTGDRSLLGSINDHVQCSKIYLDRLDASPYEAVRRLNETPMGALDYRFPCEVLVKQAGMPEMPKNAGGKIIPFPRKP
jgi:hypothetical protein